MSPDFGRFAVNSAAPGRWDRAIKNALTSAPERSGVNGKIPSKTAPRSIRRRVRPLRSSFRCLFSKIFLRFSSCRISFRTFSRSSFEGWAVFFCSCHAPFFFGNAHRLTVHFCRAKYRRSLRSAAWMDFPACDGVTPSIAAISFTFIPSI